ncbi:hypothetical protein J5N97_005843 [Dioscorea zingiberensis]|uniref:Uncharacterized protein n=1 Tax=Dioscorea zingiberensis TaxID=325984 RepID=A0A9D5DBU4_9LILI|nr:hypothetical protein J5N97_005843 [Dioscorea zingiberensis]
MNWSKKPLIHIVPNGKYTSLAFYFMEFFCHSDIKFFLQICVAVFDFRLAADGMVEVSELVDKYYTSNNKIIMSRGCSEDTKVMCLLKICQQEAVRPWFGFLLQEILSFPCRCFVFSCDHNYDATMLVFYIHLLPLFEGTPQGGYVFRLDKKHAYAS